MHRIARAPLLFCFCASPLPLRPFARSPPAQMEEDGALLLHRLPHPTSARFVQRFVTFSRKVPSSVLGCLIHVKLRHLIH
eukprot:1438144-Pleurochrysis_carterae.AAC.1